MLSEKVLELTSVQLQEVNEISMNIARELVKENFDMKELANIENHIMELARDRMLELGSKFDKQEDLIYFAGLTVEISLYLGINIGRNLGK